MDYVGIIIIGIIFCIVVAIIRAQMRNSDLAKKDYRATQAILNTGIVKAYDENAPLSDSEILDQFTAKLSQKATENFLNDFPKYDEKELKKQLCFYAQHIIVGDALPNFGGKVIKKRAKEKMIAKMGNVTIKNGYLLNYSHGRFAGKVTVTNNIDEYYVTVMGTIGANGFDVVDHYSIAKGVPVGLQK